MKRVVDATGTLYTVSESEVLVVVQHIIRASRNNSPSPAPSFLWLLLLYLR